ncbi:uncharacterized protein LOC142985499 [Anticarsia gemmatalis]|uniref:uncharacterized protein LOC142985499 n=1 Tax=Anticarsia gemmatalis TaxID=129554 RepID=UPI003F757672
MQGLVFLLLVTFFLHVDAYVLLQVRKQNDNVSKVDALIHKTVPNKKIDELKDRIGRKSYKKDFERPEDKSFENSVFNGVKQLVSQEKKSDLVESIAQKIVDFVKENAAPIYRSLKKNQALADPQVVHFRSEKPSVMLKLDTSSFIDIVQNALKSNKLNHFVDHFSKRAAVAYVDVKGKVAEAIRRNE